MIITVVDSQLRSLIPTLLRLQCVPPRTNYYNSQFKFFATKYYSTRYNNTITSNSTPNSQPAPPVIAPVIRERGATNLIPSLIPHSTGTKGIFLSLCSIFALISTEHQKLKYQPLETKASSKKCRSSNFTNLLFMIYIVF